MKENVFPFSYENLCAITEPLFNHYIHFFTIHYTTQKYNKRNLFKMDKEGKQTRPRTQVLNDMSVKALERVCLVTH